MNIRRGAAFAIVTLAAAAGIAVTMSPANAAAITKHGYECRLTAVTLAASTDSMLCSAQDGDMRDAHDARDIRDSKIVGTIVVDQSAADSPGGAPMALVCPVDTKPALEDPGSAAHRWPQCQVCLPVEADRRINVQVTATLDERARLHRAAEHGASAEPGSEHGHQDWSCPMPSFPRKGIPAA